MPASAAFESSTGFLLSQLGVLATRSWVALLSERSLTPHHHAVLLTLLAAGPRSLTELANTTLVDPRNMGPVLEPLEARGLLQRSNDPNDRRRRLIGLTLSGDAVARELAAAGEAIEAEFLAPLEPGAREALRQQLLLLWRHARQGA